MAATKNMNEQEFKKLVTKIVKEEIQKKLSEQKQLLESKNKEAKKTALLNEVKEFKKKYVVLEHRKATIEGILKEFNPSDLFGKLRGTVDPSKEVDSPKDIRKNIEKSLATTQAFAKKFQEKVLSNTSAINAYHEAISSALDKLNLLSGEEAWMQGLRQEYEGKIMDAAKTFYKLMNDEKGRIESYTKTLFSDLQAKGFDKSMLTVNKKEPSFVPSRPEKPGVMAGLADKAKDLAGNLVGKTSSLEEKKSKK